MFPAHFEGSCGKGMCGRPSTTIGFERRFNPVLQLSDDDFLQSTAEVPARPLNMTAIMATNRGAADYAWAMPHDRSDVPSVEPCDAPAWLADSHALRPRRPRAGRIRRRPRPRRRSPFRRPTWRCGSTSSRATASCWWSAQGGTRSVRAARFLKQVGYERVTNLSGGTAGWRKVGNPVE